MAFLLPRFVVGTSLPVADPGAATWVRAPLHGGLLAIMPGVAGMPYGLYAHQILAHITATALATGSRRIDLGSSLSDAMRTAGIACGARPSGGERGTLTRFRDQVRRLAEATVIYVRPVRDPAMARRIAALAEDPEAFRRAVFEGGLARAGIENPVVPFCDHPPLWTVTRRGRDGEPIEIELSREAYDLLVAAPIHLDEEVVRQLGRDVLALQVYAWLAYQALRGRRSDIKLAALARQFGATGHPGKVYMKLKAAVARVAGLVPTWRPCLEIVDGLWSRDPGRCSPAWLRITAPLEPAVGRRRRDGEAAVAAAVAARQAELYADAQAVVRTWHAGLPDPWAGAVPWDDVDTAAYDAAVADPPPDVIEARAYLAIMDASAAAERALLGLADAA